MELGLRVAAEHSESMSRNTRDGSEAGFYGLGIAHVVVIALIFVVVRCFRNTYNITVWTVPVYRDGKL